jgi:hypothetical protein
MALKRKEVVPSQAHLRCCRVTGTKKAAPGELSRRRFDDLIAG